MKTDTKGTRTKITDMRNNVFVILPRDYINENGLYDAIDFLEGKRFIALFGHTEFGKYDILFSDNFETALK